MCRSAAAAFNELRAETGTGLTVLTILSVTILSVTCLSGRVSPTSLRDSCVFSDFLAIDVNGACVCWRRRPLTRAAPQAQVEGTSATVAVVRLLETDDKAAELR